MRDPQEDPDGEAFRAKGVEFKERAPKTHIHGSRATYSRYKCKCAPCREAERAWRAKYKSPKHGLSGYTYGCRCDFCRGARAAYMRSWRRQRVNKVSSAGTDTL
jgi:hypothetical protein